MQRPVATDVFHAVAEPRRRKLIALLAEEQDRTVNEIVLRMELPQPAVSKHLGVLRRAGVVTVVKRGQHRMYRLQTEGLEPVLAWARTFEQYWTHQTSQIRQRAEQKALERVNLSKQ